MNAIRFLEDQHDQVKSLFEKFEATHSDEKKQALFNEIADALAIHTAIEEQIFYPAVFGDGTKDILLEAVEEHLGVRRLLSDLLAMKPSDEMFEAKMTVCKEQVLHHVGEERSDLFPKARKALNADQLEALGEQMQAMAATLENTQPRRAVPRQTAHAAAVH